MRRVSATCLLFVGLMAAPASSQQEPPGSDRTPADDVVVVAVIDNGFAPYHWDFAASKMPQQVDADPDNDLPLDQPPHTWLPGFPDPSSFASYNRMSLTLEDSRSDQIISVLDAIDAPKWAQVRRSTKSFDQHHFYWFPGTKVIGGLTFAPGGKIRGPSNSHGQGTTSAAVGNMFGTCPNCLLVFIQYGGVGAEAAASGEEAIGWAMRQPWIDVISNSYGFGPSQLPRSRLYQGSDTAAQREASVRGQTVFFSAGNGVRNDFIIPNTTLFSSQEGPDWIVTVGAVHPTNEGSYTGHGKPADVASVGGGYPTSYTAVRVGEQGWSGFSGTSNATPVVAGYYARALEEARRALPGPSRMQSDGIIAAQHPAPELGESPFVCGSAVSACELGDGFLTAKELRRRFFHGALHTAAGMTVGSGGAGNPPPIGEDEFLSEGYGSYFGKLRGSDVYQQEIGRIVDPMLGIASPILRPTGEREWMVVDSFCRQEIWGDWADGDFVRDASVLPGPDPLYPVRTAFEATCPHLFPPL